MADLAIDDTIDVNIANDAGTKKVTVTTDGSKERLDVDANVSGGISLSQFAPKWEYSVTTQALTNGVDTSIQLVTAKGHLDFVQIVCKNSSYETIIKIDGLEVLRIEQSDLGTIGLLSSNSTNIPIYAASASKIFAFDPAIPDDFTTSFEILVKATSAGNNLDGFMIHWNEEI
jgi:hypothetical protein